MSKLVGNQEFNGDVFVKGVGGYDGTNAGTDRKDAINSIFGALFGRYELDWLSGYSTQGQVDTFLDEAEGSGEYGEPPYCSVIWCQSYGGHFIKTSVASDGVWKQLLLDSGILNKLEAAGSDVRVSCVYDCCLELGTNFDEFYSGVILYFIHVWYNSSDVYVPVLIEI